MKMIECRNNCYINTEEISSLSIKEYDNNSSVHYFYLEAIMKNGRKHTIIRSNDDANIWNAYQELMGDLNLNIIRIDEKFRGD